MHLTGSQPPVCSNFMPLQFSTIPQKLRQADYVRAPNHLHPPHRPHLPAAPPGLAHTLPPFQETHFVGKGHLGQLTDAHLPIHRGFVRVTSVLLVGRLRTLFLIRPCR